MLDGVLGEAWHGNAGFVQSDFNIRKNGLEDGAEAEEASVWSKANIVVQEKNHVAIRLLLKLQLTWKD